ncbi:MAG: hypothetical protein VW868_09100, partial [Bacteroidota bacterium]
YIRASEYDCQKMVQLSQECFSCQQKKNCTSYHNLNCPKIDNYKKKCTDFLSQQVQALPNDGVTDPNNPEAKQNQKNEPYPIINNKGLTGSDIHTVTPDQPIPAPGMNNTQPNPSKSLSAPPSNFIMRSWY